LRLTPSGFVGMESFNNAGIRLSRSLDKNIVDRLRRLAHR